MYGFEVSGLAGSTRLKAAHFVPFQSFVLDRAFPMRLSRALSLLRKMSAPTMADYMGVPVEALPEGEYAAVEQVNPAAADFLRVCAFLHPDVIPEELLRQGLTELEPPLKALGTDDLAFHEAVRTLGAYSLLRRDRASRTLSNRRASGTAGARSPRSGGK